MTVLTAPTTLYVSPTGNDQTGNGTQTAPFATVNGAHAWALANLNTAGFTVTYSLAAGTYLGTFITQPLIGGGTEIISGAGTSSTFLEGSSTSGYAFGMNGYAQVKLENLTLAQPSFLNDTVSVGSGQLNFGQGITFGDNRNPNNDLTANGGAAAIRFESSYTVTKTWVYGTATFSSGQTSFMVSNLNGPIQPGMTPMGNGISTYALVGSVAGTVPTQTVALSNGGTTASVSNSQVIFAFGGQCHMDIDAGAQVFFLTNGGQSPFNVTFSGYVGYYDSMFHVNAAATVELGANWSGNVAAFRYSVHNNGVLQTYGQLSAMPGSYGNGISDSGGQVS
jgi:hypothetical protein